MIHSCTVHEHQLQGYRQPGLLSQKAFCRPCKTELVHYGHVGPLGSTNQNWLGGQLLPMAVSIYPVVYVHPCHLLGAQHHCLWPNDRESPPSACPATPSQLAPFPPTYSLISPIRDITGVVKKLSQKPAVNNAQQG